MFRVTLTDTLGVVSERTCGTVLVAVSCIALGDEIFDRYDTEFVSRTTPARYVSIRVEAVADQPKVKAVADTGRRQ